jgi:hypothetical protein
MNIQSEQDAYQRRHARLSIEWWAFFILINLAKVVAQRGGILSNQ